MTSIVVSGTIDLSAGRRLFYCPKLAQSRLGRFSHFPADNRNAPYLLEEEMRDKLGRFTKGYKGALNPAWKGGRYKDSCGYILVLRPKHPFRKSNDYVLEHRLVVEKQIGRYLTPEESVHHKNGIKTDNRPENLEIMVGKVHKGKVICPHCQKEFLIR